VRKSRPDLRVTPWRRRHERLEEEARKDFPGIRAESASLTATPVAKDKARFLERPGVAASTRTDDAASPKFVVVSVAPGAMGNIIKRRWE